MSLKTQRLEEARQEQDRKIRELREENASLKARIGQLQAIPAALTERLDLEEVAGSKSIPVATLRTVLRDAANEQRQANR